MQDDIQRLKGQKKKGKIRKKERKKKKLMGTIFFQAVSF
jgi:hypothetical protein